MCKAPRSYRLVHCAVGQEKWALPCEALFCGTRPCRAVVWWLDVGSFLQGGWSPLIVAAAAREDSEVSCCLSLCRAERFDLLTLLHQLRHSHSWYHTASMWTTLDTTLLFLCERRYFCTTGGLIQNKITKIQQQVADIFCEFSGCHGVIRPVELIRCSLCAGDTTVA